MSLKKGRLIHVDEQYVKSVFGEENLKDLMKEFSENNFRAKILRRDFNIPIISEEIMLSEDMKYIIKDKKPILASTIEKITMHFI